MTEPDFFTQIAMEIFGIGYMDVDKNTRRKVKTIVLQMSYGKDDRPIDPIPDYDTVRTLGTITGRFQTHKPALAHGIVDTKPKPQT